MSTPIEAHFESTRPLRILEIGGQPLAHLAVPDQTEFYWTGTKPRAYAKQALGPMNFIRAMRKLRRGQFDLLIVHAPQYAPWHPRSFLTVLRDWNILAPVGLFATFVSRLIHLFHNTPIAVIDLDDSNRIGRHNYFLLRACVAFFKRELPIDRWQVFCHAFFPNFPGRAWRSSAGHIEMVEKLRPISYGPTALYFGLFSMPQQPPSPQKSSDIFFAGTVTGNSTVRLDGLLELRALRDEGYVVDIPDKRLAPDEFFRRMSAAWLAWSPSGLGWECSRHYEAALVGSVALMNTPTIALDLPLQDGVHCAHYSVEPGGLRQVARRALADKARLRDLARAACKHVMLHHTLHARIDRVTCTVLGRHLDGTRSTTYCGTDVPGSERSHGRPVRRLT
jgi:hypothetical protein